MTPITREELRTEEKELIEHVATLEKMSSEPDATSRSHIMLERTKEELEKVRKRLYKTFVVVHQHRHGESYYTVRSVEPPKQDQIIDQVLTEDWYSDRAEFIEVYEVNEEDAIIITHT